MHLKEDIIQFLKSIGVDTRQAVVGLIIVGIISAYGGLLYLSKTVLNYSILLLTSPTPLWATILLVLLGCLYTYKKSRKAIPLSLLSTSPSAKLTKIKHIPFEDLIWIATRYSDGTIQVQDIPRCKEHDLLLTYDGHTYHCPEQIYDRCSMKLEPSAIPRLKSRLRPY